MISFSWIKTFQKSPLCFLHKSPPVHIQTHEPSSDLPQENHQRVNIFFDYAKKTKNTAWSYFLPMLNRQDLFTVHMVSGWRPTYVRVLATALPRCWAGPRDGCRCLWSLMHMHTHARTCTHTHSRTHRKKNHLRIGCRITSHVPP